MRLPKLTRLVAAVMLCGCGRDHDKNLSPFPVVPVPTFQCCDYKHPGICEDISALVVRRANNDICFEDGRCFYDCPPSAEP